MAHRRNRMPLDRNADPAGDRFEQFDVEARSTRVAGHQRRIGCGDTDAEDAPAFDLAQGCIDRQQIDAGKQRADQGDGGQVPERS